MPSYVEKNKMFIYTVIMACILVGVSWGSAQVQISNVAAQAKSNEFKLAKECERSSKEDSTRAQQVVRIEQQLKSLENRSVEVKKAIDKTNDKLDWLIRQQIKTND